MQQSDGTVAMSRRYAEPGAHWLLGHHSLTAESAAAHTVLANGHYTLTAAQGRSLLGVEGFHEHVQDSKTVMPVC